MNNVMVDLETLGTRPGCIVLSIGAVLFDETGTGEEFYCEISQDSCRLFGLHADPNTLVWWKKQNDQAKEVLWRTRDGGMKLPDAAEAFSDWLKLHIPGAKLVWGDGADFDNTILTEAFRVAGFYPPWSFTGNRCYRTLKNLASHIGFERSGIYHHALDDARVQAKHASEILRWLRKAAA